MGPSINNESTKQHISARKHSLNKGVQKKSLNNGIINIDTFCKWSVYLCFVLTTAHYGCPTNWKQYGGQCYRIFDQGVDWLTARTNCQQTSGADLATIRSQGTQNFINREYSDSVLKHDYDYTR